MTRRQGTPEQEHARRLAGIREAITAANGDWHEATALWSIGADLNWLLELAEAATPDAERLDVELLTGDKHQSALDVGSIVRAVSKRGNGVRLQGLWVQWHGDGTNRANRKGDVIVSVQFGWPGSAVAEDGTGHTVHEATADLLARLAAPTATEPSGE